MKHNDMTEEENKWQRQLHEMIGNIVHNQARLEHGLSVWISNLAYIDPEIGLILTSEMPFRLRINALQAMVVYKTKEFPKLETIRPSIDALVTILNTVEQERNKYAHSSLLSIDGDDSYVRAKYTAKSSGLKLCSEDFHLNDLKEIKRKQEDALNKLSELFNESKTLVKPLPRKVREALHELKMKQQ